MIIYTSVTDHMVDIMSILSEEITDVLVLGQIWNIGLHQLLHTTTCPYWYSTNGAK